jgi:hypothetical protein
MSLFEGKLNPDVVWNIDPNTTNWVLGQLEEIQNRARQREAAIRNMLHENELRLKEITIQLGRAFRR